MNSLTRYLKSHGIRFSEEEFADVVRESVARVYGSRPPGGPSELPLEERRQLEEGGLRFGPPPRGSENPVVRAAATYAALLGSSLSVSEAARRLGVNPSRVRQRLSGPRPTLYGIKRDNEWHLPRFQLAKRGAVPGIGVVIAELDRELHPVAVYRWFTTPNPDLEPEEGAPPLSPLDWLQSGHDPGVVARLAADL